MKFKKFLRLSAPFILMMIVLNSGYFIKNDQMHLAFNLIFLTLAVILLIYSVSIDRKNINKSLESNKTVKVLITVSVIFAIITTVVFVIVFYWIGLN